MSKAKSKSKSSHQDSCKYVFEQIEDEALSCRYGNIFDWQRKDLSKEELFEYAEEMRKMLDRIFYLALDARLEV